MLKDRKHMPGLDYLRVIAAFAVVWIHTADTNPFLDDGKMWTKFAVPSFVVMTFLLMFRSLDMRPASFRGFVSKRFVRLMVPFYAWACVYTGARVVKCVALPENFDLDPVYVLLLGGGCYHLWFLSAVFYLSVIFYTLYVLQISRTSRTANAVIYGTLFLLIAIPYLRISAFVGEPGDPGFVYRNYAVHFFYRPVFWACAAVAIWNALNIEKVFAFLSRSSIWLIVGGLIAYAVGVCNDIELLWTIAVVGFFVGILLIPDHSVPRVIKAISARSLGIYVVHVLFVEGLQAGATLTHVGVSSVHATLLVMLAAYFGSYFITGLLGRFSITRKVFL